MSDAPDADDVSVPSSVEEDDDVTVDKKVERTDVGVSLTAKLKRGTGTRDQDELTAKVKREEYDDAKAEMEGAMEDLHEWAGRLRVIQPDADAPAHGLLAANGAQRYCEGCDMWIGVDHWEDDDHATHRSTEE